MGKLRRFMEELHITTSTGNDAKLGDVLSWPQADLIRRVEEDIAAGRPSRYIILKARQIGISTIVEGLQFALALSKPRFRGLVVAQDNDNAAHLLSMTHYYYDSFWGKAAYPTKYAARYQMAWLHINSHIKIATAKNTSKGRGSTLQFLHASEVAFWDKGEELMTGLAQSVHPMPQTFIFLESTANGVGGFFYNTWQEACSSDSFSQYTPLFYPYWAHPTYKAENIGLAHMCDGEFTPMDEEERTLIRFLSQPRTVVGVDYPAMSMDEIKSRLIWRRYTLTNRCQGDLNKLHQEYPATPEEAFISTGTNVFDLEALKRVYQPINGHRGRLIDEPNGKVRFIRDNTGPLEIYEYPSPDRNFTHYLIGGDGKKAVQSVSGAPGDYACAQVLDRKSWKQVARWRGRLDQNAFGEEMIRLGRFYHMATLAPETGMGGPGVAAHIVARGYPMDRIYQHRSSNRLPGQMDNQWGWITNARTKFEAIGNLQAALHDGTITIHDAITYEEMKNYVVIGSGFGNADGKENHDDTVMALAIALTCTMHEGVLLGSMPQYAPLPAPSAESYTVDKMAADLNIPEASVMSGGKMIQGRRDDAPYLDDQWVDVYGQGEY